MKLNIKKYKQFLFGIAAALIVTTLISNMPSVSSKLASPSEPAYDYNDEAGYTDYSAEPAEESYRNKGESADAYMAETDQMMIYTSNLYLEVTDTDEAVDSIEGLIKKYQSYIQSISSYINPGHTYYVEDVRYDRNESKGYHINVRVKAENLDAFIDDLEKLGHVTSYSKSAYNVTEQYTDLESRLKLHQTKLERLNELMSETASLSDLITLENAISQEIYQIDNIMTQMKGLDKEIDYSNVYISLVEEEDTTLTVTKTNLFEELKDAIIISLNEFVSNLVFILKSVIYLVPYAIILALGLLIYKRTKKQ